VFIECTATDLTKAKVVLNTVCSMFSEYCSSPYVVEPVEVIDSFGESHGEQQCSAWYASDSTVGFLGTVLFRGPWLSSTARATMKGNVSYCGCAG
jgi:hypothetical protein